MLTRAAIVICLLATGCVEESYENGRLGGKSLEKELCPTGCSDDISRFISGKQFDEVGDRRYVTGELGAADVCAVLPSVGLCPLACDPDALQDQVPTSTCISFRCALTDGRDLLVGACAPNVELTP